MKPTVRAGPALGLAAIGLVAAAVLLLPPGSTRVAVSAGVSVQEALDSAGAGTTLVLGPGIHRGPLTIRSNVTLEGEPGAQIIAPPSAGAALAIVADDAHVSNVQITGAESGVVVREAEGIVIEDVAIFGSSMHGIEVVDASARIDGARVAGLTGPFAQGIEIRNGDGRADSTVTNSTVVGGREGIVTHVSEVRFTDNVVSDTTMRGIVVTEMSDGYVSGNRVGPGAGAGLYCGDMSRCDFRDNSVSAIAPVEGGRSTAGWGLVVTYHAMASSSGDRFDASAGTTYTSLGGHVTDRSPLDPGSPADVAVPLAIAIAVALALGLGAFAATRLVPSAWTRATSGRDLPRLAVATTVVAAVAVQTFHMVEHFLQVYRVNIDHIPSRGGLAGPGVDSEWVHMAYNGVVLALIVAGLLLLRGRIAPTGARLLLAATVVQGWHAVEHTAKVIEHVATGAKVSPGLLGGFFNLVWFHFTINLVVYALCVGAAAVCLWGLRRPAGQTVGRPAPAPTL